MEKMQQSRKLPVRAELITCAEGFLVVLASHKKCVYALPPDAVTSQESMHMLLKSGQAPAKLSATFRAILKVVTQKTDNKQFAALKNHVIKLLFCTLVVQQELYMLWLHLSLFCYNETMKMSSLIRMACDFASPQST